MIPDLPNASSDIIETMEGQQAKGGGRKGAQGFCPSVDISEPLFRELIWVTGKGKRKGRKKEERRNERLVVEDKSKWKA